MLTRDGKTVTATGGPLWVAWRCPVCGWSNNRDHEGLDKCDKCSTEIATAYGPWADELLVKWCRDPQQPNCARVTG